MKTISCAYKTPDYSGEIASTSDIKNQKTKDVFPSICLEGDAATQIAKNLKAGDEMTATVRFKATEVTDRRGSKYGNDGSRVELEAIEISPKSVSNSRDQDSTDSDDTASDAIKDYFGKKKTTQAPRELDDEDPESEFDEYD